MRLFHFSIRHSLTALCVCSDGDRGGLAGNHAGGRDMHTDTPPWPCSLPLGTSVLVHVNHNPCPTLCMFSVTLV